MPASDRLKALLLLASMVVVWGSNWTIMKIGLQYMDPFWLSAGRMLIALVASIALLLYLGRFRVPHQQDVPIVLGVGLMQFAAFVTLICMALEQVGAGRAAVLAYTTPLWVTPAAAWVLKERLTPLKMVGVLVGLSGVLILFNPFSFDWSNRDVVIGNGYLLLAALIWALSIVHVRYHRWRASVLELLPWQLMVALAVVLPIAMFSDTRPFILNQTSVWVLVYNGILATAYAQWASVRMTQLLPAVTVSLGLLLVPVAGLGMATYWLNEPFSLSLGLGMLLIICGLGLQMKMKK